jgi:hypothetical protein
MSIQNAPIDEERAKIKAQKELAHEIGNLPYLGDMEHEDNEYVFPLHVRLPFVCQMPNVGTFHGSLCAQD